MVNLMLYIYNIIIITKIYTFFYQTHKKYSQPRGFLIYGNKQSYQISGNTENAAPMVFFSLLGEKNREKLDKRNQHKDKNLKQTSENKEHEVFVFK